MSQRTYGQHCGLAAALDVIGDRWTMLIVRELSAGGLPFTALGRCLPGLSSALLSRRLKELQLAGLVQHDTDTDPTYRLTANGRDLGPALAALGAWGYRRLAGVTTAGEDTAARRDPLWTLQTLAATRPTGPARSTAIVNVEVNDRWYHLTRGGAAVRRDAHPDGQASVRIDHDALESIRVGATTLEEAIDTGHATVRGDRRAALRCFQRDAAASA